MTRTKMMVMMLTNMTVIKYVDPLVTVKMKMTVMTVMMATVMTMMTVMTARMKMRTAKN